MKGYKVMTNENDAAAKSFIDRGKELVRKTKDDMDTGEEKCKVSPSLPWLVLWIVECKLNELEANAAEENSFRLGPFVATGRTACRALILGVLALLIFERAGLIDLSMLASGIK